MRAARPDDPERWSPRIHDLNSYLKGYRTEQSKGGHNAFTLILSDMSICTFH